MARVALMKFDLFDDSCCPVGNWIDQLVFQLIRPPSINWVDRSINLQTIYYWVSWLDLIDDDYVHGHATVFKFHFFRANDGKIVFKTNSSHLWAKVKLSTWFILDDLDLVFGPLFKAVYLWMVISYKPWTLLVTQNTQPFYVNATFYVA